MSERNCFPEWVVASSRCIFPLVLWNFVYLVILWIVFQKRPQSEILKEININFATAAVLAYVNAVFAITDHPIGFQFWFVRDLFVTVLVSPIIWLMLTRAPWSLLLVLCVARRLRLWIFFRSDVVFFFDLGGLLRLYKAPLEMQNVRYALASWRLHPSGRASDCGTICRRMGPSARGWTPSMRLIGVVACWGMFQAMALTEFGACVARYGGFAFFLHAAHFPFLAAVKIASGTFYRLKASSGCCCIIWSA